jgi:hypothetical protein
MVWMMTYSYVLSPKSGDFRQLWKWMWRIFAIGVLTNQQTLKLWLIWYVNSEGEGNSIMIMRVYNSVSPDTLQYNYEKSRDN